MDERIEALQANRLANEQWTEECQRLDPADQAILKYKLDHEEKMLAAEHALGRLQNRQHSTRCRPADHRRLAERLAPACLKDALARIEDEIERRTHVGKITVGSNPLLLDGPMYRQATAAEQAARARAEAAKLKLENLFTLEADLAPLIVKVFADLRRADGEAEQAELERTAVPVQPGQRGTKPKTLKEREALAAAAAGGYADDGLDAEIEVG